MVICIYHSADLDGACSAAIVRKKYPDCELRPMNYGDKINWDVCSNDTVIMVDFSLEPFELMCTLCNFAEHMIWVDHHETALRALAECTDPAAARIDAWCEIGKAGCELTWTRFFPGVRIPHAVSLLGRYDVWDHADPRVMPFQYGLRAEDTAPDAPIWDELLGDAPLLVQEIAAQGEAILRYFAKNESTFLRDTLFETQLGGLRAVASNKVFANSKLFDSFDFAARPDIELMINFGFDARPAWRVSLSPAPGKAINVAEIAATFGGGGHKGRAGFTCSELPFSLPAATPCESFDLE